MKNLSIISVLVLFFLVNSCRSEEKVRSFSMKVNTPNVYEFDLHLFNISYQIKSATKIPGLLYIQSFDKEKHTSGEWYVIKIPKGNFTNSGHFETYEPNGRIIYVPVYSIFEKDSISAGGLVKDIPYIKTSATDSVVVTIIDQVDFPQ